MVKLHRAAGILFLLAFVMTGKYMDIHLHHLRGWADAPRALYRSGHIYLLFSALLNLSVGRQARHAENYAGLVVRVTGSALLLAAPVLFLCGFFLETPLFIVERPITRLGIYSCLVGVLLHAIARYAHETAPQPAALTDQSASTQ